MIQKKALALNIKRATLSEKLQMKKLVLKLKVKWHREFW